MQKIALITDSACDLPLDILNLKNIKLLPLGIIQSTDNYENNMKAVPKDIYINLHKEIQTIPLPSIKTIENLLDKIEHEGYTHVIAISISSGLSGSYSSLSLCLENHPNLTSFVYDSKILAYPQGEIVLEVSKLIECGTSFENIIEMLPTIRRRITGYFTINNLDYLKSGSKVHKLFKNLYSLLNIKLIITTDENGTYYTVCRARGRKRALLKMTDILKEYLLKGKSEVTILQGGCELEAIDYMDSLKNLPNIVNLKTAKINTTLSIHINSGLIGFSVKLIE